MSIKIYNTQMLDVNNTALSKSIVKIGISVLLVGVPPQYFYVSTQYEKNIVVKIDDVLNDFDSFIVIRVFINIEIPFCKADEL